MIKANNYMFWLKVLRVCVSCVLIFFFGLAGGCANKNKEDIFIQCQSSKYGAMKIEKLNIVISKDGKLKYVKDGLSGEKLLKKGEVESIHSLVDKSKFNELNNTYGRAVPDGGFRHMVIENKGFRHEVIIYFLQENEASLVEREELKRFSAVWDYIIFLSKEYD